MLLLTPDEVAQLTGLRYPKRQAAWLQAHGYKYEIGADGRPKVARSFVEARLGAVNSSPRQPRLRLPNAQAPH